MWDALPPDRIHVVLEGELTMTFTGQEVKLGPNENRKMRNNTNSVATMLVVMPYAPQ
jgi:hypothetical protein